jgi:hypothetical protein
MSDATKLQNVKNALQITGDYMDATLSIYIDEAEEYMIGAGVAAEDITPGVLARGVADLWNYGAGEGKLSEYFKQRVAQLAFRG